MALRRHHRIALEPARTHARASRPIQGFTSLRRRPRFEPRLAAKILLPSPSRPSGRDRPVVVLAAAGHQRVDDPRDLVGDRHRGQLELVCDRLALEHRARPQTQGVVMASAMAKRRAGTHHQELAQITVAHLGDEPEPLLAPGRTLARRQAEEGGELAPLAKALMSLIVAVIAEAVTGSTPGMVISRLAVSSALTDAASSLSIAG